MAKFCGKCGSKLDEMTGLCPQCSMLGGQFDQGNTAGMETDTKKGKSIVLQVCIWLCVWIILGAIVVGGLVYFDVLDIPFIDDAVEKVETILHREHEWIDATCVTPKVCEICEETEGAPLGHKWTTETCVDAAQCSVCGETGKPAKGHSWIAATCTEPKLCLVCNETDGVAAGHAWMDATYKAPKMCQICGETDGEPLKPDPVYLVDLGYSDKYGKLWTWGEYVLNYYTDTNPNDSSSYLDMYTQGHTSGIVYDHLGNRYTNGLCVDLGGPASAYYISYDLDGIYTTFSGVCSLIEGMKGTSYTKYFEVYCDGKLVFTSDTMTKGSAPQPFTIDVTDVQVLRIQYPATKGQNRIATVFDAKLS